MKEVSGRWQARVSVGVLIWVRRFGSELNGRAGQATPPAALSTAQAYKSVVFPYLLYFSLVLFPFRPIVRACPSLSYHSQCRIPSDLSSAISLHLFSSLRSNPPHPNTRPTFPSHVLKRRTPHPRP